MEQPKMVPHKGSVWKGLCKEPLWFFKKTAGEQNFKSKSRNS